MQRAGKEKRKIEHSLFCSYFFLFLFATVLDLVRCFEIDRLLERDSVLIESVSLESSDYVSVLLLPMFTYNPDEGGRSVLYYMITEEHKEFGIENNAFKFVRPNCI